MTSNIPLIALAAAHGGRTAIIDSNGLYSYDDLLKASSRVASGLLAGGVDLEEARVAFLVPSGFHHVATQWGIWRAGGVAVPIATTDTVPEIEYRIQDSRASVVVAHPETAAVMRPIAAAMARRFALTTDLLVTDETPLPAIETSRKAMIVYTSGTTSKPKGVVTTHTNVTAQVKTLVQAWEWTANDRIVNPLPLHHVHGIINVLSCAMWAGAVCEMVPKFSADKVWERLASGDLSLYMAVPTTYKALIAFWEKAPPEQRKRMAEGCRKLRLMVSGSDSLPIDTFERWREITGHTLLERYGMSEVGMAISNPLHGERIAGHVGRPLPGVQIRVVELDMAHFEETGAHRHGPEVTRDGTPGEIQIKGDNVFAEYWDRPEATAEAFTPDGWFCSGDIASLSNGNIRIWGRASQDIIKSGGELVSAVEVQRVLKEHPDIEDCAVIGVKDAYWGKAVSAAVVLRNGKSITREAVREWARDKLAPYKLPQKVVVVDALPRNAMGKVIKPQLARLFDVGQA